MEPLEDRLSLSAPPTGWRAAIGLKHTTALSRFGVRPDTGAAVGDAGLFTGTRSGEPSATIAIYDARTARWSRAALAQPSAPRIAASAGSKVLFVSDVTTPPDPIGVYDAGTGQASTTNLPGFSTTFPLPIATAVDGLIVFDTGDIYDTNNGQWSSTLSIEAQGRRPGAATTVGDLAIFAGGIAEDPQTQAGYDPTDAVDIYNAATGQWTNAHLSLARTGLAATSVGDLAFFGGGDTAAGFTDVVDIYNADTGQWSVSHLSQPRALLASTSTQNFAIFAGGESTKSASAERTADIYDSATGTWSRTRLSSARSGIAAVTAAGRAIFAGGTNTESLGSDIVDIFTPIPGVVASVSGTAGKTLSVTIHNHGTTNVPVGATLALYASPDGTPDAATLLGSTVLASGLAGGASAKVIVSTSISGLKNGGKYHLIGTLDDDTGQGDVVIATQTRAFTVRATAAARRAANPAAHPFALKAGPLHAWPVTS
jgi:hypothetical protein